VTPSARNAAQEAMLARRRRIAGLVQTGKRIGYGLFLVAIVVFVLGMAAGFTTTMTTTIVASLLVGSVILAPAIVFGYGLRAAEREERAAAD